jgi:cytochrome c553
MPRPFHDRSKSLKSMAPSIQFTAPAALTAFLLFSTGALAAETIEEKAKLCATCHGEHGIPTQKNIPVIWGQNEGYLIYQLRDFKSGARKNRSGAAEDLADLMLPIAAGIDPKDVTAFAAYFTKLKWPNLEQPAAPAGIATKAQTTAASVGCPGCHLAYFQGDGTTARLAGQNREYLLKTMKDFRDNARGNNPGMSDLMKATSEEDIAALAEYLAGLQIEAYLGNGR